jgi:hypothetical protein
MHSKIDDKNTDGNSTVYIHKNHKINGEICVKCIKFKTGGNRIQDKLKCIY